MRVAQIGNFDPPHSTENHLKLAMEYRGWTVIPWQENDPVTFTSLRDIEGVDLVLWTRTGWDWERPLHNGASYPGGKRQAWSDQRRMLRRCRDRKIPVVGYHLDIWFGLKRATEVDHDPFFESTLMVTADGGHPDEWKTRNIDHVWFPPGVSLSECEVGTFREELASPIAFVGNWDGSYHQESKHRHELVEFLKQNFRDRCEFWPKRGELAARGEKLRDLYASVDVLVGDSCFVGTGLPNYWSDRIPETLGRGGYLLHPDVPGLGDHFISGKHLQCWRPREWDELGALIENALAFPETTRDIALAGREHTRGHHTYEHRMVQLELILHDRGLL